MALNVEKMLGSLFLTGIENVRRVLPFSRFSQIIRRRRRKAIYNIVSFGNDIFQKV